MSNVIVSDSPHIRGNATTKRIMIDVLIALLPATVMGIVYFGLKACIVLLLSVVSAIATEFVYKLCLKQNFKKIIRDFDFTSAITGLLLGLCLPSTVYWYVPVLSSIFAVAIVKMLFGGTGQNIVNPAITGRVFAFIAFPAIMTSGYVLPKIEAIFEIVLSSASASTSDVWTGATALTTLLSDGISYFTYSKTDLFLGTGVAGCIGETCKLALIVGGVYLSIRKVICPVYPIIYIGVCGLFTVMLNGFDFEYFLPSILSGGLILGAIFMATDYVTSPTTKVGRVIYYTALGLLTAGLRKATGIEVVSFAILLMNLVVPLITRFTRPRNFGEKSRFTSIKEKFSKKEKNV